MDEIKEKIKYYVLENAVKHKGEAAKGAIIGKLIAENPDIKSQMKEISPKIDEIISEINSMEQEKQKTLLLEMDPEYEKKQEEIKKKNKESRKELPPLRNAEEGKVITRIAPEPSKYNHAGHAVSFLLNYIYAIKYKGKCILRFEDTNPEKASQEYVKAMEEDVLNYLNIQTEKTVYVSDHIEMYYDFAKKLIEEDKAYTCTCDKKTMSGLRREMKPCVCRDKDKQTILQEWKKMQEGNLEEGSITLRLKIDMQHKNAVMRDPVIFRLCYKEHYRQGKKYKVWPMYDFENAIEEGKLGITHVLRSDEFQTRIELQNHIRSLFNLPDPEIRQYARFNITGSVTKGREIRDLIESGDYIGWDDPRLVTLRALKRRGIIKETFYELSKVIGMSKSSSNLDFSVIASINRKLLDKKAKRYFFLKNPVEIKIEDAPEKEIELDLHPDLDIGKRKFNINKKYYLEKNDLEKLSDNEIVRLIDNLNFIIKDGKYHYDSEDYMKFKDKGKNIIHFLPAEDKLIDTEILMPDNKVIKGKSEKSILELKPGEVIQFQRFGFCRLDEIKQDGTRRFWFTHE
ncbi:MAG: glutamate--tRNA ligase [Nanobdellota archaeon]